MSGFAEAKLKATSIELLMPCFIDLRLLVLVMLTLRWQGRTDR